MKCPVCKEPSLVMTERQGIEIDYCPDCRGVWLDRGELDKLLDKASSSPAPGHRTFDTRPVREANDSPAWRDDRSGGFDDRRKMPYKKHKSWLSEIFD